MGKSNELSARQEKILEYIKDQLKLKGYPPSVREIGEAVGLSSSSTVHGHLSQLEKKGYIRRDPAKPRAIEIMNNGKGAKAEELERLAMLDEIVQIPLVGQVAAGMPILAEQNIEATYPLPLSFAKDEESFLLRVKGNSMINAGILDGDNILVRPQAVARNGEIVVALIEDEATVKRFFLESDCVRLQPENDSLEPIYTKEAKIIGKVIGVFRQIH